ncbi:MAG: T9SS type A sorting domain-containing protein [Candidatus Azobacteroides sp.]|nr:T9SS type A sorting domain-containing protein [Candidatus Azobacteroides sp.]
MKKFTFKLLMVAIILCLPLLKSVAQAVIPIGSAVELRGIGIDADKPMNGSYVLTDDIDLSGVNDWVPIGMSGGRTLTYGNANANSFNFSGTFDGKEHAIKNLTYSFSGTYSGTSANFANDELTGGLFARVTGTIRNLELRNLTMSGNCVSALAASLATSKIENVSVIGCTISGTEVGGISGRTNGTGQVITNCYVDQTTTISGTTKVGGFIGNIGQAIGVIMTNCYMAATMTSTGSDPVYGVAGNYGTPSNAGNMGLNAVFVMAQAATGTTLKPFTPDDTKIGAAGSLYFACSDYFPAETYPELYPATETDPSFVKTLAELQTEATYADLGWDFDNIWQIAADKFPIFQWQKYPGQPTGISPVQAGLLWNVIGLNNRIEVTVSEPSLLSVYDITGKILFAAHINSKVSIPATGGIYILKLRNAGKEAVRKIIMQ